MGWNKNFPGRKISKGGGEDYSEPESTLISFMLIKKSLQSQLITDNFMTDIIFLLSMLKLSDGKGFWLTWFHFLFLMEVYSLY